MKAIRTICCLLTVFFQSAILSAQDSHWSTNVYDYKYDMTVYAQVSLQEGLVTDFSGYELAAFVGDECRALGEVQSQDNCHWVRFRVRSNSSEGEFVTFRLYDKDGRTESNLLASVPIVFQSASRVGYPSEPVNLMIAYHVGVTSINPDMGSACIDNAVGLVIANSPVLFTASPAEGHSFVAWLKDGSTVSTENPYTHLLTADTELKAVFKTNQYTISFDADGGSQVASITQDYATEVMAPASPTRTGYTFVGWDREIPATIPAEDVTLKAQWQINQYTISFDTDGGSEVAPITQDYATEVMAPTSPTRTGYTFVGWDKEIPATILAEDVTLKAQWQVNQYKLTFVADGEGVFTTVLDYNAPVTDVPSAPEKTGYTFTGWGEIPETMPAEDLTFKAAYQVNQYQVGFYVDNELFFSQMVNYQDAVSVPEAIPQKEGHTFEDWTGVPEAMPAEDVMVYATFVVNTYKLTYILDGVVCAEFDVPYASSIEPFKPEIGEGKLFGGWTDVPETMPAENLTIVGSTKPDAIGLVRDPGVVDVYTLKGNLVLHNVSRQFATSNLAPGYYIINGKKVQVK